MKLASLKLVIYVICMSFVYATENKKKKDENSNDSTGKSSTTEDMNLLFFQKGFKHKRAQQLTAVRTILGLQGYSKQFKMVEIVVANIFKLLQESKIEITASGYVPGDSFPKDEKTRNALAHILENTAFFGDILLRLPDITHQIFRKTKEWQLLAKWSVSFANESKIYDETDTKLLNLMAQELQLVPKDPNYINPYKIISLMEQAVAKEQGRLKEQPKKKKKQKKKRGPRLSGEL